jgi:hypothetical protein
VDAAALARMLLGQLAWAEASAGLRVPWCCALAKPSGLLACGRAWAKPVSEEAYAVYVFPFLYVLAKLPVRCNGLTKSLY